MAVAAPSAGAASLQLATAALPANVDRASFCRQMLQFASTLTSNGRNMPFALPLKVDSLQDGNGFQISLLRVTPLGVLSVADLVANVEAVPGSGDVLMVRLYEGQAAAELGLAGKSTDPKQRLETLLSACIDVPQIMATMPEAIKRAVALAR